MNRDASQPDRRWMELMGAMRDGVITPAQVKELEQRIASDPKAADQYLQFMTLHALLLRRRPTAGAAAQPLKMHRPLRRWLPIGIAAAAMILIAGWLGVTSRWTVGNFAYAREELSVKLRYNSNWVAALSLVEHGTLATGKKTDSKTFDVPVKPGKGLDRDQHYRVKSGWVPVSFYDGAEVILQEHATIVPLDKRSLRLEEGRVHIRVMDSVQPFTVHAGDLRIDIRGQALVERDAAGAVEIGCLNEGCEIRRGDQKLPVQPTPDRALRINVDGAIAATSFKPVDFEVGWAENMGQAAASPAASTGRVTAVTFSPGQLLAYDDQDGLFNKGTRMEVLDGGATLRLTGNCWKRLALKQTIHPETVLEFDFRSGSQGELHGIGFDTDNSHRTGRTLFQLHGIDALWCGIYAYRDYSGSDWVHYRIPVGRFYTGDMSDLVFWADDDEHGAAESLFRNVVIRD